MKDNGDAPDLRKIRIRRSDIDRTGPSGMPCDFGAMVTDLSKVRARPHGRTERILEEQMLQIGQQQFLMLLFMIETQFKQVWAALDDERHSCDDRIVDVLPVRQHLGERRSSEHPALATSMKGAFRLVIAVEQEGPPLVERPVPLNVIAKNERLEEPACMSKVPFGG
jgi:hypothetical protein